MREIVDDGDAAGFTANLHAARHAAKGAQRFLDGLARNAAAIGDGNRGQRVQHVVAARPAQAQCARALRLGAPRENAWPPRGIQGRRRSSRLSPLETVGFDRTKRLRHDSAHRRAFAPADDASAARNQIHQAAELQLDGGEIGVNIGVIEFERGDDQIVGTVVQEFRAFVEEGGVVFVALDDEFPAPAQAVALCRNFRPRRRSGNRGGVRQREKSRRAAKWWWFCRACR